LICFILLLLFTREKPFVNKMFSPRPFPKNFNIRRVLPITTVYSVIFAQALFISAKHVFAASSRVSRRAQNARIPPRA
jgi:hypothetical protein